MDKVIIQMVFNTSEFMNFEFIYNLLNHLDLLKSGTIELGPYYIFKYDNYILSNDIRNINYKWHGLKIFASNTKINMRITNPHIIGFSELTIECQKNDEIAEKYVDILLCLKMIFI